MNIRPLWRNLFWRAGDTRAPKTYKRMIFVGKMAVNVYASSGTIPGRRGAFGATEVNTTDEENKGSVKTSPSTHFAFHYK